MAMLDRLPALPLVASDPYFSIWMPADTPTQTDSCHWSGPEKPLRGSLTVDGAAFRSWAQALRRRRSSPPSR